MKDDGDERFFAAEARLNQRLDPGDEASEAELPAVKGMAISSPQFQKLQQWIRQQSLQATTVTGWTAMVDTDDAADVAGAGGSRLQPPTECSNQVEGVAGEEMLDGVFKSWPYQCGKEATELLDLLASAGNAGDGCSPKLRSPRYRINLGPPQGLELLPSKPSALIVSGRLKKLACARDGGKDAKG